MFSHGVFHSVEMAYTSFKSSLISLNIVLYYLGLLYLVYKSCHLTIFHFIYLFIYLFLRGFCLWGPTNLNTWNPTHVGTRRNLKNHVAIAFLPPFPEGLIVVQFSRICQQFQSYVSSHHFSSELQT